MIKSLFKCLRKKQISINEDEFTKEFAQTVKNIRERNQQIIIERRLVPFLNDFAIATDGYMPDAERVYKLANALFHRAKLEGVLDELNTVRGAV